MYVNINILHKLYQQFHRPTRIQKKKVSFIQMQITKLHYSYNTFIKKIINLVRLHCVDEKKIK